MCTAVSGQHSKHMARSTLTFPRSACSTTDSGCARAHMPYGRLLMASIATRRARTVCEAPRMMHKIGEDMNQDREKKDFRHQCIQIVHHVLDGAWLQEGALPTKALTMTVPT